MVRLRLILDQNKKLVSSNKRIKNSKIAYWVLYGLGLFHYLMKIWEVKMLYSLKSIGFGAIAVIIVMIVGQYILDILQIEISNLWLGGLAGMIGAYVLMQTKDNNNNDKDKK